MRPPTWGFKFRVTVQDNLGTDFLKLLPTYILFLIRLIHRLKFDLHRFLALPACPSGPNITHLIFLVCGAGAAELMPGGGLGLR